MFEVEVTATVNYVCYLNKEDSEMVREYAEENDLTLEEAVATLYGNNEINLYRESTESDFCTESIDAVTDYEGH